MKIQVKIKTEDWEKYREVGDNGKNMKKKDHLNNIFSFLI